MTALLDGSGYPGDTCMSPTQPFLGQSSEHCDHGLAQINDGSEPHLPPIQTDAWAQPDVWQLVSQTLLQRPDITHTPPFITCSRPVQTTLDQGRCRGDPRCAGKLQATPRAGHDGQNKTLSCSASEFHINLSMSSYTRVLAFDASVFCCVTLSIDDYDTVVYCVCV